MPKRPPIREQSIASPPHRPRLGVVSIESVAGNELGQGQLSQALSARELDLNRCYAAALKKNPQLNGRLSAYVRLPGTRAVELLRVDAPPEVAGVTACVRAIVRKLRLPFAGATGEYRIQLMADPTGTLLFSLGDLAI